MGARDRNKPAHKITWGLTVNYFENMNKLKISHTIFDEKPRESLDVIRAYMLPRPITGGVRLKTFKTIFNSLKIKEERVLKRC